MKVHNLLRYWYTRLSQSIRLFSPLEKAVFAVLILVCGLSLGALLVRGNNLISIEIPTKGGSVVEGVVGSPRFINPLLAISDSDRDLSMLLYSGLMRATPENGLVADLAESYRISDDGLTYTFTLLDTAVFHDGEKVTADDVVFTVVMAQNASLKSPRRASWDGVFAQKVDEKTVEFTLPQPYAPFLENATLGILPEHLWGEVSPEEFPFSQFNIEPVGTGPFALQTIKRSGSGLPESYKLSSFKHYTLGEPFLNSVTFIFYPNEEELVEGYKSEEVEAINSIAPERAQALEADGARIETSPLPRIFGVFFNQNQRDIFTDTILREALARSVPKQRIVDEILKGFGTTITSPIPPGIIGVEEPFSEGEETPEAIQDFLIENGWERDEESGILIKEEGDEVKRLSFSISTSNTLELKSIASIVAEAWRSIGAQVDLRFFETSDLNQNVIRPRNYDALLFGEIIGRELDLFSFWHSSQRNDPGLNIALYANITADQLLEDARANTLREERYELFKAFEKEVRAETPAVFLYSPFFIYVVSEEIKGLSLVPITTGAERFLNVHEWYKETEKIWSFFNT